MNPIELIVTNETIEKMKKYYDSQMVQSDDDILFEANSIGCNIIASLTNHVTFVGENALKEAAHWSKKYKNELEKDIQESSSCDFPHIGTSETGSDDYLGPICFVSCYVTEEDIEFIRSFNIQNVEDLSTQDIINYAKQIKDHVKYGLLILDNSHYNKMIDEGMNLSSIKAKLMNQITVNMIQKIKNPISTKVMKKFVATKTYYNYLKNEVAVVKDITFDEYAQNKYMGVLAANILSQYAYLQYFTNMSRSLKIKLARGTNSDVDQIAAKICKKYGLNILRKTTKTNFTNTKKVNALLNKK